MATNRGTTGVGWLTDVSGPVWPGLLLNPDAFVVQAPANVFGFPSGDLRVVTASGQSRRIGEILIVAEAGPQVDHQADRETDHEADAVLDPGAALVTAMIRLREPVAGQGSTFLNRAAVRRALAAGSTLWAAVSEQAAVPEPWPAAPVDRAAPDAPRDPLAVKTVTTTDEDWCTIFWWLC